MMKNYILFGAGIDGRHALRLLGMRSVAYFCDNVKAGSNIQGIDVISFEKLKRIYRDYDVIITTSKVRNVIEITSQLKEENIPYRLLEDVANESIMKDLDLYTSLNQRENFSVTKEYMYPLYLDKVVGAGMFTSYFWQDLWAAQHIFSCRPELHYDIGSRVDGFIAHLCAFHQKVRLLDIRPLENKIPGVDFIECDATNLENIEDESIDSLSALCSLEHFGLGRYGDPIDPEACFKCFAAIQRKIKKGGKVYISVPIGKEHLEFNAHRVFYAKTIVDSFHQMRLKEFSSADNDSIQYHIDIHHHDCKEEKGGELFGLFVFEKE